MGRPGCPWGLGRPPRLGCRVHDSVGGDAPLKGAHVSVLERALGPQGDLNRLFDQVGLGKNLVAVRGDVQNPEPDLGRPLLPSSRSGTFGHLSETAFESSNTGMFGEPDFFYPSLWRPVG
jgi:hypothetical protein